MIVAMETKNKVFINPAGFIEIIVVGDQTADTFNDLYEQAIALIPEMNKQGKPVRGLVDLTDEGNFTISSNKAALQLMEKVNYDKLALCNAPLPEIVKAVIMAIGKNDKTKLFDTRAQAIVWLLT